MSSSTQPILLIFHEKTSTGGCIPFLLNEMEAPFTACRHRFDDKLPDISSVRSVIVFGGTNSANDSHEAWIGEELRWIENALKAKLPMFNICLGAQMLAKVLGSQIKKLPDNKIECGYYPLKVTAPDSRLRDLQQVYHWHSECFDLPNGARCLAEGSEICPIQAFDYDNALAVQFHPEINKDCINTWSCRDKHDLLKMNACSLENHYKEHLNFHIQNRMWLKNEVLPWLTK